MTDKNINNYNVKDKHNKVTYKKTAEGRTQTGIKYSHHPQTKKAEDGTCSKKGTECSESSSMAKKARLGFKGSLGL